MSAYQDLMTALAMRRPDQSAAEDERIVEAALAKHAHELAERLRNVHGSGEGDGWNWWDAADIPAACADLIDPQLGAGPVRPGEETTP